MPANFQFGNEHYLYLGIDSGTGQPVALTSTIVGAGTVHCNNLATWTLCDNVRDVDVGGNATSVNITTRAEARSGFSTEVDVTVTGQLTFQMRYIPGVTADPVFKALLRAALQRKEIAVLELDAIKSADDALGVCSNATVSYQLQKPVEGVVVANVTLKLTTFQEWVQATATGGTSFAAFT